MNRYNEYKKPTLELVLRLLYNAYEDEYKLDKVLQGISDKVFAELKKEIEKMVEDGKIDLTQEIDLHNNPAIYGALKRIEQREWRELVEYYWIGAQVIKDSLVRSYKETITTTYDIFGYQKALDPYHFDTSEPGPHHLNPQIQITDTYIIDKVLNIPWCQDGKTYSERLYGHVAQFQKKLDYVLEEGIAKGKGMDWMMSSWKKLTGSTAYDTARLLKTETMAMWSQATKTAYLEMGIEYVEIIGDALCGGICLDYVGEAVPLAEAELGDLLPPYHPNCACSYVAYEESVKVPVEEIEDDFEGESD